jgi:hypothetical protein
MRKTCTLVLVLALVLMAVGVANAATSAEKQAVIDKGLAYLASTQNQNPLDPNYGSWNYYVSNVAATASALLAFTEQYYKPAGWNGQNYMSVVTNATNYLLSQTQQLPFNTVNGANWWGFSGIANTGYGLRWGAGTGEDTYITGLVIPALSRLVFNPYGGASIYSPSTLISSSNSWVNNKSYAYVIQSGVDSFAWYQNGPTYGNPGGWRYYADYHDSDMSTTQWAPISFLFASNVSGVVIPDDPAHSMKTALKTWIAACQDPSGGVSYQPGSGIGPNATHAGGFLLSNYFAGGGGSAANALAWLNAHWTDNATGDTWYGNEGHPYAMWSVYKALETLYGVTGAGPITNLHPQGSNQIDPGATWNWWEDYCQYLVDSQLADGSWPGYSYPYWYGPLEAGWYINILNATVTTQVVPLPGTLGLLSTGLFGLLGAGWWRRRKS